MLLILKKKKKYFFLDNYKFQDKEGKFHFHDNLKELNDNNTELFINSKKVPYEKFFTHRKMNTYNITLKFNIKLKDCSFMFAGCNYIKQINFINFDTSKTNNMEYMFADCQQLKNINLYTFKTKNVTNMSKMFYNCNNLINLDLSSFDTKAVINLSYIFAECKNLENINLYHFNTNKVSNMSNMFYNCLQLKKINLSSFNTKNVLNMSYMFYNCINLINLNLSSFDTKNVNNMSNMFFGCENLYDLNISSFNTKNAIDMNKMFFYCKNLTNFDLSSFDFTNTEKVSDIFSDCGRFNNVDLSFLSNELINYATEIVILFINGTQTDEKDDDYLIHKLESLKFFQKKGDIIKYKGKIILSNDNKNYIINLIRYNQTNINLKADCLILEYNSNDIKSFNNMKNLWNQYNIINKSVLTYLIGINNEIGYKNNITEAKVFCNLNKIKHILISTKKEEDIKNFLNEILTKSKIQEEPDEFSFKILILDGENNGFGKTSLIKRIIDNEFNESFSPPFRSDYSKTIYLKTGNKVNLNFIEGNNIEKNKELIFQQIEESYFILLVYDVTRENSFEGIKKKYKEILSRFEQSEKIYYLIGNKIDLYDQNKKGQAEKIKL